MGNECHVLADHLLVVLMHVIDGLFAHGNLSADNSLRYNAWGVEAG